MFKFIKQCKGKDYTKLPKSYNDTGTYLVSTKYDGNYVQIHKIRDKVMFFTSGGKPFKLDDYSIRQLLDIKEDFILEAEYIGTTDGRLGRRGECTTTTFRTEYAKGIISTLPREAHFKVFDIIDFSKTKRERVRALKEILPNNTSMTFTRVVQKTMDMEGAINHSKRLAEEGYEGVVAVEPNDMYKEGKRVNTKIKIKSRPTADLKCVDVRGGEGKYTGKIGSLVLIDKEGRMVDVGSGLTDAQRSTTPDYFIGKIIEIQYEQILDTYIQPVFVAVREDKKDL